MFTPRMGTIHGFCAGSQPGAPPRNVSFRTNRGLGGVEEGDAVFDGGRDKAGQHAVSRPSAPASVVMEWYFASRLLSVLCQAPLIQPFCSSRTSAEYRVPWFSESGWSETCARRVASA